MFQFMTVAVVIVGLCWCLKHASAVYERQQVMQHVERMKKEPGQGLNPQAAQLMTDTVERLFKPASKGGLSIGTKILIAIGAVIYIVFPGDFDFIPVAGWIDDAAVGFYALKAITKG